MKKRFELAKEEFYSEDSDGKPRLVYAFFGLAIYYGQLLEETFSNMLWTDRVFKKKVKTNREVNEIIDTIENSKKTMGNLINEVKQSYNLTEELTKKLDKILERRNYLTHKYFKLNIEKFYSEVGQLEMIEFFCDFVDDAKQIEEELRDYYSDYINKLGITEEKLTEMMDEMKRQEIKRVQR